MIGRLIITAVVAVSGRHGGPAALAADSKSFVGCYELRVSEWRPATSNPYFALPATIELLASQSKREKSAPPSTPSPEWLPFRAVSGGKEIGAESHSWRPSSKGGVELQWARDWSEGVMFEFGGDTDGLTGTAKTYTDVVGSPSHTASIRAKRIPCERLRIE